MLYVHCLSCGIGLEYTPRERRGYALWMAGVRADGVSQYANGQECAPKNGLDMRCVCSVPFRIYTRTRTHFCSQVTKSLPLDR
jgi:hypothetical protein